MQQEAQLPALLREIKYAGKNRDKTNASALQIEASQNRPSWIN